MLLVQSSKLGTGTKGLGNERMSGDHPNYYITEINKNTEKSPGYLRRFTVTQTPVKNSQGANKNNIKTELKEIPEESFQQSIDA